MDCVFAGRASPYLSCSIHLNVLQCRLMIMLVAICTYPMRWFGAAHSWLQHISERTPSQVLKLIILLFTFPCFKASHFFFKLAHALQTHRLRIACGEDFFLKFYDHSIATGSVIDVLESLREIK